MAKVGNRPQSDSQSKTAAGAPSTEQLAQDPAAALQTPSPESGDTSQAGDGEPPPETPAVVEAVLVEIPICMQMVLPDFSLHVDARLSPLQSNVLRRIAERADRDNARLANGKRVVNPTDAFKYLLELVGAQV